MKRLLTLVALLSAPFLMAEPETKSPDPVKHVDAKAAAQLLATEDKDKKPVVLDIRTPEEFAEGHIEGAKNIDFRAPDFAPTLDKLDKKQPYLVHCRSGGRSTKSLAFFKRLGFENIYHLDGGILAWEEAEQDVVK